MTSVLSLLPRTKRGRCIAGIVALAGLVHVLGALDARVGSLPVPDVPGLWLVIGVLLFPLLAGRAKSDVSLRALSVALLVLGVAGIALTRWMAGLDGVRAPFVATVRLPPDSEAPDRRVLLDELRVESRAALHQLTGRGQQVGLTVEGFIYVPSPGEHRFWIECDDDCTFQIGEIRIGKGGGAFEASLPAGTQEFRLDYHQESGPASFELDWDRPALVELLPLRKLLSGRRDQVTRAAVEARTLEAAAVLLSFSLWWAIVSAIVVRASESRGALGRRLGAAWVSLRDAPPQTSKGRSVSREDVAVAFGFLIFSLAFQSAHLGDRAPYVLLDDDAANIATFAAARDRPELFAGDEILANPRLVHWYPTVHVPLVQAMARLVGDYGTAFISLLGLHVFLQSMGFYVLGRVLFESRYWALLLAICSLAPVDLILEFWGVYEHPVPRFSFQALLPFLAAAAYVRRAEPLAWPAIAVAAGLLVYVHPVSAPAWDLAFLLGFALYLPRHWSRAKSVAVMVGLGGLFLVVVGPFAWHYVRNQEVGPVKGPASYEDIQTIISARFDAGYLELPRAFGSVFERAVSGAGWLGWAWALAGIGVVLGLRRRNRRSAALVLTWALAILVTSTVLPWIDHEIARSSRGFPLQYDLVRGLRYIVPFFVIFSLWPLAELSLRSRSVPSTRLSRRALPILGAILTAAWMYWNPFSFSLTNVGRCWSEGKLTCGPTKASEIDALDAIRERTPPGAAILPTVLPLAIRYYALRPVVHCYKDGGILAYADHDELLKWNERKRALSRAMIIDDPVARLQALANLADGLGARYLFLEASLVERVGSSDRLVWSNDEFALWEVTRSVPDGAARSDQ